MRNLDPGEKCNCEEKSPDSYDTNQDLIKKTIKV